MIPRKKAKLSGAAQSWVVAIIGGATATVLGGTILYFLVPQQRANDALGAIYCTAGKATCIASKGGQWHVINPTCPAGQSLQFASFDQCQSITPAGFSGPIATCPAACVR